ncbi:MAG: hypothetical protein AB1486_15925 [Planctomycetota bacterium]
MCHNRGPLLSPALFEELMVPRYRRIVQALRQCGVDVHVLDCDGCVCEPSFSSGSLDVLCD